MAWDVILRQPWLKSKQSASRPAIAIRPCSKVPRLKAARPRSGDSPVLVVTSQKYSSLMCETVMAPAPMASAASALPLASPKPNDISIVCTMPAVVMAATRDEPGPARIGEQAKTLPRRADQHDGQADQEQNERPADADDELTVRSAAERLARHVADRLHH